MILPFIFISPIAYNVTTAINHPVYRLWCIPCLFLSMGTQYVLFRMQTDPLGNQKRYLRNCRILLLLILATVLIPYHENGEDFLSGLHVFLGFLSFLWINRIILPLLWFQTVQRNLYLALVVFVYLLSLSFASINGLCEILYAGGIALLLGHNLNP